MPFKSSEIENHPEAVAEGGKEWIRREEMKHEWERIRNLSLHRSLKGATNLFSGVYFPPNLLDTEAANNNPKYMRLLAAVLGLEDLEEYFGFSNEGEEENSDEHSDGEQPDGQPSKEGK